jgi:hypothetical protein
MNDLQTISSNYGDCIDIYAPSEMISAPAIGSSIYGQTTLSGSSASAAIVTGIGGLLLSFLNTPLSQLLLSPLASSSPIQELLHTLPMEDRERLDQISLSSLLVSILYPPDGPIFLRNILTSIYFSLNQNRTKLVHSPSFYPCDYSDPETLLALLINSVAHLYRQHLRPRVFLNLKRNLAIHLKAQIEEYYQHSEGWDSDDDSDEDDEIEPPLPLAHTFDHDHDQDYYE